MRKPRLIYILPEYTEQNATHFAHIYDLIREAAAYFDIYLYIEKGVLPPDSFGYKKAKVLAFRRAPFRFVELLVRLFFARLRDCKDVYVHYSFIGAYAASVIVNAFGGRVFYWNAGEPWKYPKKKFREKFEQATYKKITYLVTATEELKREYARAYAIPESKIKVMPNWIDSGRFTVVNVDIIHRIRDVAKIEKGDKVVLFVHRLAARKGTKFLPAIFEHFQDQRVIFLIVGSGPDEGALMAEIGTKKLDSKIHLMGPVSNMDLANYYGVSDLFIMPSEEEGFPRVLLEAMATKTPFVAFNAGAGSVAGIVPPALAEYVVPVGDVPAFITAMEKALGASEQRIADIKIKEEAWVSRYDIKKVVEIFNTMLS